jgi:hypothetical protein
MASDDNDDLPLQNRSTIQNNELLNITISTATNACKKETSHAIIESGALYCVTPYIDNFIHQPTPIQNTTLKGISGGLPALGRGTVQLKINQENKENTILIIDNVIYAPICPIRLISLQQLHRQSKAKGHASQQQKPQQHYLTGEIRSHAPTTQKQNTNTKLRNR